MKRILLTLAATALAVFFSSCATPPAEGTKFNYGSADPYRQGQNLVEAIAHDSYPAAYRLMERGAPLNYQDKKDQWTPLAYAIYYARWRLAKVLIRAGANVDLADTANRTPLMWCAMRGSLSTAQLLVEHGANINAVDISGRTALQYAIIYDNDSVAAYLAEAGRIPSSARLKAEQLARIQKEREKEAEKQKNLKMYEDSYNLDPFKNAKNKKAQTSKAQTAEKTKSTAAPVEKSQTVKPEKKDTTKTEPKAKITTTEVKTTEKNQSAVKPAPAPDEKTVPPQPESKVNAPVPAVKTPAKTVEPVAPKAAEPEKTLEPKGKADATPPAVKAPAKTVEPVVPKAAEPEKKSVKPIKKPEGPVQKDISPPGNIPDLGEPNF